MARWSLLVVLGTLVAGCGGGGGSGSGGGGGGGGGQIQSIDITTDPINSGTTGGPQVQTGTTLQVGDLATNVELRGQLSFLLGQIPANATITLAVLRCSQTQVVGNPYGEMGNLVVDHIDQGFGLDAADHNSAALTANVGALSTDATLAVKTLVVTAQVQADFGVRPNSDFRLRFLAAPSMDGGIDQATLQMANPGEELVLRVTYTTP